MVMPLAILHTSQITITLVPLLFLFLTTLSQSQVTPPTTPTMVECGARLFALAPCTPFVQGQSHGPTQQCCDNLIQVYNTQRGCLCLFLNGTVLASLPLNSTLALQLPGLCSPQINPSTCSSSDGSVASQSPASQNSFRSNPTAARAPTVTVAPRPSTVRFDLGKSSSAYKLAANECGVTVAVIFLLLEKLL
ncbi:Protein YLS3 [Bienertia sinuspersici]